MNSLLAGLAAEPPSSSRVPGWSPADRRERHPAGRDDGSRHRGRPPASQGNNNLNILSSPTCSRRTTRRRRSSSPRTSPSSPARPANSTNLAKRHQLRPAQGRRRHVADHAPHPRERIREPGHLQEASALKQDALTLAQAASVGPTWTKRSTKTTVLVKSGDTVIISASSRIVSPRTCPRSPSSATSLSWVSLRYTVGAEKRRRTC